MNYRITAACGCNRGLKRPDNEDNFCFNGQLLPSVNSGMTDILTMEYKADERNTVLGLFDGMGGEEDGQIASHIAASVCQEMEGKEYYPPTPDLHHRIIKEADSRIRLEEKNRHESMGSTAILLSVTGDEYIITNIGDSRAFLYRDGDMSQISVDHNEAELMKKLGVTNRKPRLTRYLGSTPDEAEPEESYSTGTVCIGDRFLLSSDGLTDMVTEDVIADIMKNNEDDTQCVSSLIDEALHNGGRDNITVMIATVRRARRFGFF